MYYIWDREDTGNLKAFECFLTRFEGDKSLVKRELLQRISNYEIEYKTDDMELEPEDYPRTGTIFNFLASNKIVEILKSFKIDIQYIPSRIVKSINKQYNNFQTLNILESVNCADMEKSIVQSKQLSTGKVFNTFRKLVLDEKRIPKDKKLFWLGEKKTWLVVHQDVVNCIEKADVTGVRFIPIDEFEC